MFSISLILQVKSSLVTELIGKAYFYKKEHQQYTA